MSLSYEGSTSITLRNPNSKGIRSTYNYCSFIQRLISDPLPKMRKRRTYTIMARSSTVVGHVGYHLSMAVIKSRAGSDQRSTREIRPIRAMKRTESGKHTLSMIKPRFFTLTIWEPSIRILLQPILIFFR